MVTPSCPADCDTRSDPDRVARVTNGSIPLDDVRSMVLEVRSTLHQIGSPFARSRHPRARRIASDETLQRLEMGRLVCDEILRRLDERQLRPGSGTVSGR
jgi:hypothetical protein